MDKSMSTAVFLVVICHVAKAMAIPEAETPLGRIRGSVLKTWTGQDILAYRGIRYAKAPVGELRFKAPVPAEPWSHVLDATEDGPVCPQPGAAEFIGPPSEDCLHLNVYAKELSGAKPVIVYFHPGAFFCFTSRSDWAGPDYLLDQDIVLVTVNYRLGALGFMSTGDEHAVGNYGMKDQVLALKWVKYNIAAFGGDPKSVTITGYSAGSTSVMLHMLSPMSKGLFHRGVAMSAGVTSDWVVITDPLKFSRRLANVVGCPPTNSTKELVECLRTVPADKLGESYNGVKEGGYEPMINAPVIEPLKGGDNERFLIDYPINLIKSRQFSQTPLVLGISQNEFDESGKYFLENATQLNFINTNFENLAPIVFSYPSGTNESIEFTKKLRHFYIGDGPIEKDNKEFGKIFSDALIIVGQEQSARLFAKYGSIPLYFYMTTYIGRFSNEMDKKLNKPLGVAHHDELIYLFKNEKQFPDRFNTTDPEAKTVKRFCSFWSNLAATGDPTPSDSEIKWKAMTAELPQYLEIGEELSMKSGLPYPERNALWEMIYPIV